MDTLPPELINMILLFLDYRDVGACYCAASLFHVLTPEHKLWLKYRTKHPGTLIRKGDLTGLQYQVDELKRKDILSIINVKSVVQFDHPHILEFMMDRGACKGAESVVLGTALQWGRLNLCKLIHYKYPSIIYPDLINGFGTGVGVGQIVEADSMEILAWLHFTGVRFTAQLQELFSRRYYGLEKLKWLTAIGVNLCPLTSAARAGRFETVRWLLEKGASNKELAANMAAGEGHLLTTKLLYFNKRDVKTRWSTYPFSEATGSIVNMELCKFLHFTDAPGDPLITALCSGDLTMIHFFCTLGYSIYDTALNAAASVGPFTAIQYVHLVHSDKLPIFGVGEMNPLDCATMYGRTSIVKFLLRTGLYRPRLETLMYVADTDNIQLMHWLISGID